jgi:two-component system, OmpR family, sensor kinase
VSRVPIRWRLTAAFALAMVVVLAAAAVFVYLRLEADLNDSINSQLESGTAPADPEEGFARVVSPGERVDGAILSREELSRARDEPVVVERSVPGVEGEARILARPGSGGDVVVVARSLEDREETLEGLITSFAVGGPIAVLVASLLGYLLAGFGLRPVEAMRRRASEISFGGGVDERLPLPAAHDEVRRLGETLNEMLDRLRGSYERERRFVADASHELRTPLSVLKTELEGTLRSPGLDPGSRESLGAALSETDQLAQLADDLLLIARSADGGLPLRCESVDVRELLEQASQRFSERARSDARRISVEAPDVLSASLDPLRMRQALGNLVDNALRHGSGTVVLSARRAAGGSGVEIAVSDEGPGFSEELAPRAFERFTRGDAARTCGGAGLGLAIVSAIAEAHGGRAALDGRAIVRLSLPVSAG